MKKRLLALSLAFLLGITGSFVACAEETSSAVSAVSGEVTINYEVSLEDGTPVLIVILPQILDSDGVTDVTEARVQTLSSKADLTTLDVKYIKSVKVENGVVFHECKLSESLDSGLYYTVINYLGLDGGFKSIGIIDHVSQTDINTLVGKFNAPGADYAAIIAEDMNGIDLNDDGDTEDDGEAAPGNILSKQSADVDYYKDLADKAEFSRLLSVFKGNADFTIFTLVEAFNDATVWIRLQAEADTFGVLKAYNGEGFGKYWNLEIGDDSDYAALSVDAKNKILSTIKYGKYSDAETLSDDFTDLVVLLMFNSVKTREEVEALIDADGKYATYFAGVREIIEEAGLENEFDRAQMMTNVLSLAASCKNFDDIEDAFENAIPEKKGDGEGTILGDNGTNSFGGSGIGGVKLPSKEEIVPGSSLPFNDVPAEHWAYSYVERLYNEKVINGVAKDQFGLNSKIQRQDFIKILIGALNIPASNRESAFTDVPDGAYYTPFVMAAYDMGLVAGTGDASFNVGSNISREDVAVLIDRVIAKYNIPVENATTQFADTDLVAGYAKDAVARVAAAGIFTGDEAGKFNPKAGLSRAEACVVLARLADRVEEVK